MSAEKFKITTVVQGREKHMIWDSSKPLALDHPVQWAIENVQSGIRIRYLGGRERQILPAAIIPVRQEMIGSEQIIPVDGNDKTKAGLQVKINRLEGVIPVFQSPVDLSKNQGGFNQLIAFSGIGRALMESKTIHSAFVAYARERPVFTISRQPDGYHLKPLMNGVRLKFKGQRSTLGEIGKVWVLQENQFFHTTIIRGSRWWRFNWIHSETLLKDIVDLVSLDQQQIKGILKTLVFFCLSFVGVFALAWSVPVRPRVETETPEVPVVTFKPPTTKMVFKPVEPEKIVKPIVQKEEKRIVAKQPVINPVKEVKPKHKDNQIVMKERKQINFPKNQDQKPSAQVIADQTVKSLRDVLGGALSLTDKNVNPLKDVRSDTKNSIFSKGGVQIGHTEIKPGYAAKSSSIGTIGGELKNEMNYSQGGKVAIDHQVTSFVAVEAGGLTVEEGLTKEEVGAVIHKHMDEVRYCHESAMLYVPNIEGKVIIQFTINAAGRVEKAVVQSSTITEPLLQNCILKRMVNWQFPHPKGGIKVSVSYPFLFKTLERG